MINTLAFDPDLCTNCEMCRIVCPHGVFATDGYVARLACREACMECGACRRNCPTGAITVESGVGCAAAMIHAALFGGEPTCGPAAAAEGCGPSSCCG